MRLNKKGVTSIMYTIVIMTVLMIMMGFTSVLQKTTSINEIQGVLDTAGVAALRFGVDEAEWKVNHELVVVESVARNKFEEIVEGDVKTGRRAMLKSFDIQTVNIMRGDETPSGLALPTADRNNQYIIESVAVATYRSQPIIDLVAFSGLNFFDFLRSDKVSGVTVSGRTGDGNVEVIIRSVSRIALR